MKKILNFLFAWQFILSLGVLSFIMMAIDTDVTFIIALVLQGYIALVVVIMAVFALVINPIRRLFKKKK